MFGWLKPQTIEIIPSKFNGEVRVMKHNGKLYVTARGHEQSGNMVQRFWEKTLCQYKNLKIKEKNEAQEIKKVLVLGLGAGGVVKILEDNFPNIEKIVGVEIDPVMVEVGKKYFSLGTYRNLEYIVADANDFLNTKTTQLFDLVLFDIYHGGQVAKLKSNFFQNLARRTSEKGLFIMNLFVPDHRSANALPKKIVGFKMINSFKVDYNRALVFRKNGVK